MPFKDQYGYWRDDYPPDIQYYPDECPVCGSHHLETGLANMFDDDRSLVLTEAYGVDDDNELFAFTRDHYECERCGDTEEYGPTWYWNPGSENYDLPPILMPSEASKLEAAAENQRLEDAGQLRLID